MDNRYRKPANLSNLPESMRWVEAIPDADALDKGLRMLDKLRAALPPGRAHAVDDAKLLLENAASLYEKARSCGVSMDVQAPLLRELLPPERMASLRRVCKRLLSQIGE